MKPSNTIVVVEGHTDRDFVEAILASAGLQAPITVAGGRSSAISVARSYLSFPDRRVVLLVDAETADLGAVEERRGILRESLAAVASAARFRVLLAIPEIERYLFAPAVADAAFKPQLSPETIIRGTFEPHTTLSTIVSVSPRASKVSLTEIKKILTRPKVAESLAAIAPFTDLVEFVRSNLDGGARSQAG